MSDALGPEDDTAPTEFDEHVEYIGILVARAAGADRSLRDETLRAIEELVTNIDGGPWAGCRVAWTDDIPDSPEDWNA